MRTDDRQLVILHEYVRSNGYTVVTEKYLTEKEIQEIENTVIDGCKTLGMYDEDGILNLYTTFCEYSVFSYV